MTKNKITLTLLLVLSFVIGALEYGPIRATHDSAALFMTQTLLSTLLIFIWFRLDASARQYRPSWFLNIAVIGLAIFALPYYFFRSRGCRGGFKTLALALVVFIATMVMYRVGAWSGGTLT
ncbi:MAG: hypothetical protein HY308_01435 [Gammaproteobacteria bacterium]|nr:hypothetical protein [Gammaproteobacteria bacterium]